MSNSHGLRTTGIHTGNFGRAMVQGKRESLDLSPSLLNKEGLRVPARAEAIGRLREAFDRTEDPRMKATLAEMLRKYEASQVTPAKTNPKPDRSHWDQVKLVR